MTNAQLANTELYEAIDLLENELEVMQQKLLVFNAIIEETPDAIFVKDLQGRYLAMNSAGAELFGKPSAEWLGKTDGELYSDESAKKLLSIDLQVIETGVAHTSVEQFEHQREQLTLLCSKAPYRNERGIVVGIIGIIRDISKISLKELQPAPKPTFSIKTCISELTTQLTPYLKERDLRFTVDINNDVPQELLGDGVEISAILREIIGNAIKFSNSGDSVGLRVNTKNITKDKISLAFRIIDNGQGIPPHMQKKLSNDQGLGLGLTLAKQTIRKLQGSLKFISEEKKGSIFSFDITLPWESSE